MIKKIKCSSCGNLIEIDLYASVNVITNPELAEKIRARKINSYKCEKCGAEKEPACRFLYVDLKNQLWAWIFPEDDRKHRDQIEENLLIGLKKVRETLSDMRRPKIQLLLAFGYDELFKLIENKSKRKSSFNLKEWLGKLFKLESKAQTVKIDPLRDEPVPPCPKCKKPDEVIPIAYGRFPDNSELGVMVEQGKVHRGGCEIRPGIPLWYCKKCKIEF